MKKDPDNYFNVRHNDERGNYHIRYGLKSGKENFVGTGIFGQDVDECSKQIIHAIERFGEIDLEGEKVVVKSALIGNQLMGDLANGLRELSRDELIQLTENLNRENDIFVEGRIGPFYGSGKEVR